MKWNEHHIRNLLQENDALMLINTHFVHLLSTFTFNNLHL